MTVREPEGEAAGQQVAQRAQRRVLHHQHLAGNDNDNDNDNVMMM